MPTSRGAFPASAVCFAAFATIACFVFADLSAPAARAQKSESNVIQGYVTAVHPPDSFEVNGTPLAITTETRYGLIGSKSTSALSAMPDELSVGAFVRVTETFDKSANVKTANKVLLRDGQGKKLSGYGVIEEVKPVGSERVFQADGYRIRVTPSTVVDFHGSVKSLNDVGPGNWIRYEGWRDKKGELDAAKVTFIAPKLGRLKALKDIRVQVASPPRGSMVDADGDVFIGRKKARLSDAGGWCGWHRLTDDTALQERIQRIGRKLIPAYQNALPVSSPARIPFRFYVVEDDRFRSELACYNGLILIPRQVVERLHSDDQVAALLADGIAFNIEFQGATLAVDPWIRQAGQVVGLAVLLSEPTLLIPFEPFDRLIQYGTALQMQEQRGRMALALMAAAGYDPWQAPEAWRLLAPKHEAADPTALRYPSRGAYQLDILYLQYGTRAANDKAAPPFSSDVRYPAAVP
jgi:hypothetical protein